MKRFCIFVFFLLTSLSFGQFPDNYAPKDGDLLFQSLPHSPLVNAIEGASESPYSHCGILYKKNNKWVVLEAIGPVKETSIKSWVTRGRGGKFDAFRLKETYQTIIPNFIKSCQSYQGRPYDIRYQLDDEYIYCSELLFKGFKHTTGEALGKTVLFGDLKWENHTQVILEIEGHVPHKREMITPRHLSEASQLEKVYTSLQPFKKLSKFNSK